MYLLQATADNFTLYALAGMILGLIITYFLIRGAINGARVTAYQEAQLKLAALTAKQNGVDVETIKAILERVESGFVQYDDQMKKELIVQTTAI